MKRLREGGTGWGWQRVAGGGVVLLFVLLLSVRLVGLPGLFPKAAGSVSGLQQAVPVGEFWMTITQGGRKIGYTHRRYFQSESGFRYAENLLIRIQAMGSLQPLTLRTTAELRPDRTLANFEFVLASNLFQFTARGAVEGKKLTLRVGGPADEQLRVIDLAEAPYLGGGFFETAGTVGLKPGEEIRLTVFDPVSLAERPVRVTFHGEEELTVSGKSRRARRLSVEFAGMKQTAWVDPDGSVLREEGILGIAMERVTREEALAGLEGAVSADLTEIASIPASMPIADPAALKILKVRVSGFSDLPFDFDADRQSYRDGVVTIRRETVAAPSGRPGIAAADLAPFLKPSPFIQSDHPQIRTRAAEIVGKSALDVQKAERLVAWVFQNLQKRPVLSVPNALETLQRRIGDCNEHAVLLAALARAAGLPAEVEAGVVYLNGRFFYHAWNVLYLRERGWVTADAALGQLPADVTHIRFIRGEAERQLDLVGLVGRLKLEILEIGQ